MKAKRNKRKAERSTPLDRNARLAERYARAEGKRAVLARRTADAKDDAESADLYYHLLQVKLAEATDRAEKARAEMIAALGADATKGENA